MSSAAQTNNKREEKIFLRDCGIEEQMLDPDIFFHIQHLVLLYPERFTALRKLRHITRLITAQYLFWKLLEKEEGVRIKLFSTELQLPSGNRPVLGILVGINTLKENQICEERHLLQAVCHCLPNARLVNDSSIINQRKQSKKTLLFYVEVEKEDGRPFEREEIHYLRNNLSRELLKQIENVFHPTFMPRNEEEVIRNIVILSKQLKYVDDRPQVILTFDTQTQQAISFNVVLLRVLRPKDRPFPEILKKFPYQYSIQECKSAGLLRKKYPKEANVFQVKLDKKPFLRKDSSLDLFKARRAVTVELGRLLGEIRDYNGGILSKQHEVFHNLCKEITPTHRNAEFLLENFFYSLAPSLMQSLLSSEVLKKLFLMFLAALEHNYRKKEFFLLTEDLSDSLLVMVGASDPYLKENIFTEIQHLGIPTSSFTSAYVELQGIAYLGLLYQSFDAEARRRFSNALYALFEPFPPCP